LQDAKQATFTYSGVFGGVRQKLFSILVEFEYRGWFISYRMDTPVAGKEEALGLLLEFIRMAPLPSKVYTLQTTDFFALAMTGTPQSVQAAINKGADVNARDKNGVTALMCAAGRNPNPEVITTLLEAGAKLEAQNKFATTALMYAASDNSNPR
jgi:hypothetical protein